MESSALIWQVAIVFAICVSLVILSGKSALNLLVSSAATPSNRQRPWRFDSATILFLLYVILLPAISLKITTVAVPDLNLDERSTCSEIIDVGENADHSQDVSNDNTQAEQVPKKKSIATQHPMARLLIRSYGTSRFTIVLFVFFLAVVCVAPLAEEFIFRVVIQGAFENAILSDDKQDVAVKDKPSKYKLALVIGMPAIIFALLHSGTAESPNAPISSELLFRMTVGSLISNIVVLLIGVFFFLRFYKVESNEGVCSYFHTLKQRSFFKTSSKITKEFYQGIVLYLIAAPIILSLNLLVQKIFPDRIVAPVPILIFAIWNGYIYYKTRRYAVCVGTHVALNFTSFIFLLLNVRAHTFGFLLECFT